jgi:hypothetical protein
VRTDGPDSAYTIIQSRSPSVSPPAAILSRDAWGPVAGLGIPWDSRPRHAGGQRWFSVYPGRKIKAFDSLRRTGIDQTWNDICADCHSTNVRKNYDPKGRGHNTTYAEMNVACEACHGPGSDHVAWAKETEGSTQLKREGLTIALDERKNTDWMLDSMTGKPHCTAPRAGESEIEGMCPLPLAAFRDP